MKRILLLAETLKVPEPLLVIPWESNSGPSHYGFVFRVMLDWIPWRNSLEIPYSFLHKLLQGLTCEEVKGVKTTAFGWITVTFLLVNKFVH